MAFDDLKDKLPFGRGACPPKTLGQKSKCLRGYRLEDRLSGSLKPWGLFIFYGERNLFIDKIGE
jgi:hypothetical protein